MKTGSSGQRFRRLKSYSTALLTAVVLIVLYVAYKAHWRVQPGDSIPDIALGSLDGEVVELAELRGRIVVLNFFATWCPPCRLELQEIHEDLWTRIKDDEDIFLGTVSRGESLETVRRFVRTKGYEWTFLIDQDGEAFEQVAFWKGGIPRTLIIDREGLIRYLHMGDERGTASVLLREVERLKSERRGDGADGA